MVDAVWIVGIIIAVAMSVGGPFAIGFWILKPLDRAAKNRKAPVQFTLMDFLGLMFLLQGPLALIHSMLADRNPTNVWVVGGFAFVAMSVIWAAAVQTFSRAGIRNVRQRAVLVFLVMPIAYLGSFAVAVVPFLVYRASTAGDIPFQLLVVEILLIVGIVYSGYFTRWVTRQTPTQ